MHKPKGQEQSHNRNDHVTPAFGEMMIEKRFHIATDQSRAQFTKAPDEIFGEVDRNRVHQAA